MICGFVECLVDGDYDHGLQPRIFQKKSAYSQKSSKFIFPTVFLSGDVGNACSSSVLAGGNMLSREAVGN